MTAFLYRRLAYHVDGTQVYILGKFPQPIGNHNANVLTTLPVDDPRQFEATSLEAMNRTEGPAAKIDYRRVGMLFLFPVPMRIRGILPFIRQSWWQRISGLTVHTRLKGTRLEYSQDVSDVGGGTWVDLGAIPQPYGHEIPDTDVRTELPGLLVDHRTRENGSTFYSFYVPTPVPGDDTPTGLNEPWSAVGTHVRSAQDLGILWKTDYAAGVGGVAPYDLREVTALRVMFEDLPAPPGYRVTSPDPLKATMFANFYLYGNPEQGAWRNYMQVQDSKYHDAELARLLSWGIAPWDSSADRGIRIQNLSPTHTAWNIEVFFDPGGLVLPYVLANQFVLSLDGGVEWSSKVILSSLGPGATSPEILTRRVTLTGDALGPTQPLIRTRVTEWRDEPPPNSFASGVTVISSKVRERVSA